MTLHMRRSAWTLGRGMKKGALPTKEAPLFLCYDEGQVLDHAKCQHRIGHLLEARDIGAFHIVDIAIALIAIFGALFVDAFH